MQYHQSERDGIELFHVFSAVGSLGLAHSIQFQPGRNHT